MSQPNLAGVSSETRTSYEKKLQGRRRRFWSWFSTWIVGLLFVLWLFHYTGGPKSVGDQPLNGAPQFIVLSLVVIFAAYLRQVSASAVEQRNSIIGGDVCGYPPDRGYAYVEDKLNALDDTVYALSLAAPFMISLAIVAAGRIMLDGVSKFWLGKEIGWLLYYIDLGIALWLVGIFSVLAWVHRCARAEDDRIQIEERRVEPEILKGLGHRVRNYQDGESPERPSTDTKA